MRKLLARELENLRINAGGDGINEHASVFDTTGLVLEEEAGGVEAEVVLESADVCRALRHGRSGAGVLGAIAGGRAIRRHANETATSVQGNAAARRKSAVASVRILSEDAICVLKKP